VVDAIPTGVSKQSVRKVEAEMPTVEVTRENFEYVIEGTGLVLVDFWAG
jgi:hypothetical protein